MSINESLSKGLKSQFFNMWEDEIQSAFVAFGKIAPKIDLRSRNNYPKFISTHRECFKRVSMAYVVGGSKRKPFIGMVLLQPEKHKYLDRIETSITGSVHAINITELDSNEKTVSGRTTFSISDHAIARIYQRATDIQKKDVIDPYIIINEFSYIPLWSSFWCPVLSEGPDPFADQAISPVNLMIPAPNGIFLGKFSKHGPSSELMFFEIRTYVQNDQLSESQKNLRKFMISTQKNLANSVACLFPHSHLFQTNQAGIALESVLIRDCIKSKLRTKIIDIATEFISDNFMAYKFSSSLNEKFKTHFSDELINHFDLKLQEFDYAAFSNEARRLMQITGKNSGI
jgi:hypothetical protein